MQTAREGSIKVYRIDFDTPTHGRLIEWHGTKIETAYACKHLVDDGFTPSAKPVSIPTEKANLIKWLNANFHSDNG